MAVDKLTIKERKFVDLVSQGVGKAEAARRAGYSQKLASVLASELQKKPSVAAALEERRAYFRSIADVEAKDIIGAQAEMAFASIEDALDDDGKLDFKKAKENGSAKLIKKISRQQTQYGETVAVEFYSRADALGQLSDILGLKQQPRQNEMDAELKRLDAIVHNFAEEKGITLSEAAKSLIDAVPGLTPEISTKLTSETVQ